MDSLNATEQCPKFRFLGWLEHTAMPLGRIGLTTTILPRRQCSLHLEIDSVSTALHKSIILAHCNMPCFQMGLGVYVSAYVRMGPVSHRHPKWVLLLYWRVHLCVCACLALLVRTGHSCQSGHPYVHRKFRQF